MKLLAVCRGAPEILPGKRSRTGINKHPVSGATMIDQAGIVGDAVCNTSVHGGPDQAILLEGSQTLDWWAEELGRDIPPGTFGENLVVEGLDNRDVAVGDRFHVGEVVLEATCPRSPCATFTAKMNDPGIARRYFRAGRPGIYCRVITPGIVSPGEAVRHEPYSGERIPIAAMLAAIVNEPSAEEKARILSAPIGARWRPSFEV